ESKTILQTLGLAVPSPSATEPRPALRVLWESKQSALCLAPLGSWGPPANFPLFHLRPSSQVAPRLGRDAWPVSVRWLVATPPAQGWPRSAVSSSRVASTSRYRKANRQKRG